MQIREKVASLPKILDAMGWERETVFFMHHAAIQLFTLLGLDRLESSGLANTGSQTFT